MPLSPAALESLNVRQMTVQDLESQIDYLRAGTQFAKLSAPATVGHGILKLNSDEQQRCTAFYDAQTADLTPLKFVPASGAATRMFKFLFEYLQQAVATPEVTEFANHLDDFAFSADLKNHCRRHDIPFACDSAGLHGVVNALISDSGLDYGRKPKGLIPFHRTGSDVHTAFEEHLAEARAYALNSRGQGQLHFTVAPEHMDTIAAHIDARLNQDYRDIDLQVSMSIQHAHSDTIAVDLSNQPITCDDGQLLFRPGGHGALIDNLNDLQAALVFIKNIDNIASPKWHASIAQSKRVLAGLALMIQAEVFAWLRRLDAGEIEEPHELVAWMEHRLGQKVTAQLRGLNKQDAMSFLHQRLDRPIRVCGMVRNQGQPGGGPFWVQEKTGIESLQIVETSEIDMANPSMAKMVTEASHFNPVDLVCLAQDYRGKAFDLRRFRNDQAYFISSKSHLGRPIKALEWPGLWNGAMAYWNTIFVEVPNYTFNPVKTVLDLLSDSHTG